MSQGGSHNIRYLLYKERRWLRLVIGSQMQSCASDLRSKAFVSNLIPNQWTFGCNLASSSLIQSRLADRPPIEWKVTIQEWVRVSLEQDGFMKRCLRYFRQKIRSSFIISELQPAQKTLVYFALGLYPALSLSASNRLPKAKWLRGIKSFNHFISIHRHCLG